MYHLRSRARWIAPALVVALALTFAPRAARADFTDRDKDLLKEAVRNLQTSTQMARLARDQASDPDVKKFADQVIGGDDKMIDRLRDIAERNRFRFDEDPTRPDEQRLRDLRDSRGREFDRRYVSAAMHDQQELLQLFKRGSDDARNEDLRQFFREKEEAVRAHADTVRELNRRLDDKSDHDRDRR